MDAQGGPVTVSVARRPLPGREAEYEAWISRVTAEVSRWPGYLGVNVLRPAASTGFTYVAIYRFATWEQCHAYERSAERAALLADLTGLVEDDGEIKKVTGMEFWFDLPEVPAMASPSPHKMALVITVVAYTIVMGINLALGSTLAGLPLWGRALITISGQVVLMTYLVMPWVTRLLRPWLFGK